MKGIPCILLLSILYFSCSHKEKKDAAIIPEKKMREVMWDMMRADQYITDYAVKDSAFNRKEESLKLYRQIFLLHNISADQFKKSLAYYGSRPDLLRPILDSLAKTKIISPAPKTYPVPDSTRILHGKRPVN